MDNISPPLPEVSFKDEKYINEWQNKLLKWTILMPTLLILIFISLASFQLYQFNKQIGLYQNHEDDIIEVAANASLNASGQHSENYRLYMLAKMEDLAMRRRYSQGGILLMSRIFTKYLGFFTGMIMAIVGAVFIISKIREDSSDISGSVNQQLNFKILSTSPGVIFGILGTILMMATILQHSEINIKDQPLFLNQGNLLFNGNENKPGIEKNKEEQIFSLPDSSIRKSSAANIDSMMSNARPE